MNWIFVKKFLESFGLREKEVYNHDLFRVHIENGRFYPQTNMMGPWKTFIVDKDHWVFEPPEFEGFPDILRAEVEIAEAENILKNQ